MSESIYNKIGKRMGKDVRLVRAAAHHPFEFFSDLMKNPSDHRPIRFRYLGVFYVKPYWRKGLRRTEKVGLPPDDTLIWARIPITANGKEYTGLREGMVTDGQFISFDGEVRCSVDKIKFWVVSV